MRSKARIPSRLSSWNSHNRSSSWKVLTSRKSSKTRKSSRNCSIFGNAKTLILEFSKTSPTKVSSRAGKATEAAGHTPSTTLKTVGQEGSRAGGNTHKTKKRKARHSRDD